GGEEVLAGKWGGLFLGYLLEKNFRRRDRDHLVPPGGWMHSLPCRGVLSFRSGAREASGSETPRVHNVAWWCGGVPLTVRAQQPERVRRIGVLLMLAGSAIRRSVRLIGARAGRRDQHSCCHGLRMLPAPVSTGGPGRT